MVMHPMVKTLKAAMRKHSILKHYADKLNSTSLDQCLTFGYCRAHYYVESIYSTNGDGRLVLTPDVGNRFLNWLPCDSEYKAEWVAFEEALKGMVIIY